MAFKHVVVLIVLACSQITEGMRLSPAAQKSSMASTGASKANTTFDILLCDKMCMQCPDGRNILIQRQKGTIRSAIAIGAGLMSFGTGAVLVNQLAGCNKIGFEFWRNHELEEEQTLRTEGFFGLFPKSGLETLKEQVNEETSENDKLALDQCDKLSGAYMWQAIRGAFDDQDGGAFELQQQFARECLSHSRLCGTSAENGADVFGFHDENELRVNRINPFVHEGFCAHLQSGDKSMEMIPEGLERGIEETGHDTLEAPVELDLVESGSDASSDQMLPIEDPQMKAQIKEMATDARHTAETVQEAGKMLKDVAVTHKEPLEDTEKIQSVKVFCSSQEQQARCANKITPAAATACKDRCCLDVCSFHIPQNKYASCTMECVKN